jgi:hypothetical protein
LRSFVQLFILIIGFGARNVNAQISSATLFGTITDPSGGAIAGATVEARNEGTQAARGATTNASGQYAISDLSAARYSLTIKQAGFKTFKAQNIELQVAQRALINATLQVGAVEQDITVTAAAPIIDTATSSLGQVVNTDAVERMPLNGRSFWQLTALTPGATYNPGGQGTRTGGSSIRSSVVAVNVNGGANNQTGWFLDGAFITEMQTGGTLIQPNIDALQEFKVQGGNMDAEHGRTPSAINATMRSGTNEFHGTLFEFLRNSAFDSRNFFYLPPAGSTQSKDPLRRNDYGFTFGGPIVKNKTFFFADLEKTGLLQGVDFNNVVPSAPLVGGNFSSITTASKPLLDPLNRQPFAGNILPASRISPQALYFLKYLPAPNTIVGSTSYAALTNNLLQQQIRGDIRIDQAFGTTWQLNGRYSINDNDENDPNPFTTLGAFPLHSRAQNANISLTHEFSSRWTNESRVSYYRSIFLFGPTLAGTNFNREAGVKGFDDTTSIYSFPQITLTGYATFTGSPSDQRPKSNRIRNLQYADNMSWTSGRHNVKFGADLMHQTAGFYNGSRSVGIFNFANTYSSYSFADFLLGYPDSVSRDYFKQLNGNWANFWSFYVQDSFRARKNLTINYGLRFEINSLYNGIRGQKTAFNFSNAKLIIPSTIDPAVQPLTAQLQQLFADRLEYTNDLGLPSSIQPSRKNFAPRIGFAWRPGSSDKLVIRTGFGTFFNFPDSNTINNTVASVPFIAAQTVSNDRPPAVPSRTWADYFLGQSVVTANPTRAVCAFGFVANSCSTPDVDSGQLDMRITYVNEWNFAVQRQISTSNSFEVAYVGNKTTHLNQNIGMNDPLPGPGNIQNRRPYRQWGAFVYATFNENANYNALQAKFDQRLWHGATMLLSYTHAKCIDSGTLQGGATVTLLKFNRGVCDFDLPNTFAGSFVYALPFGKGKQFFNGAHGVVNQLINGWELAGIVTLRSGVPFTPTVSGDLANTGVGSQRPDVTGTPLMVKNPACWFYSSANSSCAGLAPGGKDSFALPPAQVRYGTGGRNILRADGLKQIDFTVIKSFPFSEKRALEFRAEMFNFLNHPTFSAPTTTINTSSGGQVSSTLNAARIIQLAIKLRF